MVPLHRFPHPARGERHVGVPDAVRLERVDDRVDDRRRRTDGRRLADALGADRVVRRRRDRVPRLPVGHLHRGRDQIVHQRTGEAVALLVEGDHLHQRHAHAVGEAAVHLPLDDHRVDLRAAVVDGDEPPDLHLRRPRVDVDHADVGAERVREVRRVVADLGLEAALHAVGQVAGPVGPHRHVLDRDRLLRIALDAERPGLVFDVGDRRLEHARGDDLRLVAHLAGHERGGGPRHRRRPAAVRTEPERRVVGVAVHHLDVLGRDAELVGDDLGERRLVSLALRHHRQSDHRLAGRVHPQLAAVGHAETEDVHVLPRSGADGLGEERDADAHQLAALALLRLFPAQLVVAGHRHRLAHRRFVVARVVDPAGLRRVRELVGLDEVLQPQFRRVHVEFVGEHVDHPLDQVDRLGDAERAGVGDAARRLVGVDGGHVGVRRLDVVAPREHTEEARRVLHRRRGAVERPVVGEHVGADGADLAVLAGRDLAPHDVVAGEPGAHEILGAVLHPLHRLADHERGDDGAHVAGIDRHLVAESTADVRCDDPDLVFRQPGHEGVHRAVGVRCLGRAPQRELARRHARRRPRSRTSPWARGGPAGRRCPPTRPPRRRRTQPRWRPCRRLPSRSSGCSSCPRGRRG